MVRHDFFGQRFIAREREATGVAAGVGELEEFEVGDDVLVEGVQATEAFDDVEDDFGFEFVGGAADDGHVVDEFEFVDIVAELFEGLADVYFGADAGDLLFG